MRALDSESGEPAIQVTGYACGTQDPRSVSDRPRTMFAGLLREVHAAQEGLEARVGAQAVKNRDTEVKHIGIARLEACLAVLQIGQTLLRCPGLLGATGKQKRPSSQGSCQ